MQKFKEGVGSHGTKREEKKAKRKGEGGWLRDHGREFRKSERERGRFLFGSVWKLFIFRNFFFSCCLVSFFVKKGRGGIIERKGGRKLVCLPLISLAFCLWSFQETKVANQCCNSVFCHLMIRKWFFFLLPLTWWLCYSTPIPRTCMSLLPSYLWMCNEIIARKVRGWRWVCPNFTLLSLSYVWTLPSLMTRKGEYALHGCRKHEAFMKNHSLLSTLHGF